MLEPLEALIEARPGDPELHFLYGTASVGTGHSSQGLWSLRRAAEAPGWELRAGVEVARAALQSDDAPTAIEAATRVLEREPDQRPALDIRAEARVRKGDYEAALADVARLRELDPKSGELELIRLRALIGLRRIEESDALFRELEQRSAAGELELPPDRYCAARATFHAERGEAELARESFERCLDEYPADPLVLEAALGFFDPRGESESLEKLLRRAIEHEPVAVQARQELAKRLRASGRREEAEQILLAGTALEPAELAANHWGALARHYFELEAYEKSAEAWSHVIEVFPDPGPELLLSYADALALAGEYARALEVGAKLPDTHRALLRGRVLLEQHRPREALAALDAAIRLWPDNPSARYYAARAAEQNGDFERAISEYRASIRSGAEVTDAGLRLGRLHFFEGAFEPARFALYQHLEKHREDVEAWALYARVEGRLGKREHANQVLERLKRLPGQSGRSLVEVAALLAAASGDAAAVELLTRRLADAAAPERSDAGVLRSLVEHLARAGRPSEAVAKARAAAAERPGEAELQEIYGSALEADGAPREQIEAAHELALALVPGHPASLHALAKLASARGEVDAAVDLYTRALAGAPKGSPEEAAIGSDSARQLLEAKRFADAEALLEDLLWRHPIDARIAELLAEALHEQDPRSERASELERRAQRFGRAG